MQEMRSSNDQITRLFETPEVKNNTMWNKAKMLVVKIGNRASI
jgi:hypothetical protein